MALKKTNIILETKFDIPFVVFGISSSEKILSISIELNKIFDVNLSLSKSIENKEIKGVSFNSFSNNNSQNEITYFLVSNKSNNINLFDVYKKIDYLFIISSNEQITINTNEFIKKIKSKLFLLVTELKLNSKKENALINDILYQLLTE